MMPRRTVLCLVCLLGSPGTAFAGDDKKPAEQYADLLAMYDAPLRTYLNNPPKAKMAAEPFLKLATDFPKDKVAFDALNWVVTHILFMPESGQAMDILARDHSDRAELVDVVRFLDLYYGEAFDPLVKLLRHLIVHSPNEAVRGNASLALARKLRQKREKAERDTFANALSSKGIAVPYAERPTITENEWKQIKLERERLLQSVATDYGRVRSGENDLATLAASELRSVVVGDVAPEIDGVDVDGNRFKLSDYRGKVVLVSFSASWCAPCVASYPKNRQLVIEHNERPFVLLSVNADNEKTSLQKSIESKDITWRCWWDSGPNGPICSRWNVTSFPTLIVIDGRGVVRFKNPHAPELDHAITFLLDEIAQPQ